VVEAPAPAWLEALEAFETVAGARAVGDWAVAAAETPGGDA
jgi:hypothetical protein